MKSYCKCEIKTASRWQQGTVNKWVIATELNHLKDWFIQSQNSCCSETQIEMIFVGEIEQKHSILCLKRKCVNIKFFFNKLLYKINITFVIMLLFGQKGIGTRQSRFLTRPDILIFFICLTGKAVRKQKHTHIYIYIYIYIYIHLFKKILPEKKALSLEEEKGQVLKPPCMSMWACVWICVVNAAPSQSKW